MIIYKQLTLFILVLISFLQLVNSKELPQSKIIQVPKEIQLLNYRTSNLVYNDDDLKTIHNYINNSLSSVNTKELEKAHDFSYTSKRVMESVQLPKESILLIRRYAISMRNQVFVIKNKSKRFLNEIIWWSEVRSIENINELISFLNNQIQSERKKEALKMFVEKGMIEQIEFWSTRIKFKRSELYFKLSLRKAKIINALKAKKPNLKVILIDELKTSIVNMLPFINEKTYKEDYDHLLWLFKQFGIHNDEDVIQEILKNLLNNEFFYNIKVIKTIPKKQGINSLSGIKDVINESTRRALNPYEPIKHPNLIH